MSNQITLEDLRNRESLVFAFPVGIVQKFWDKNKGRWAIIPKYEYLPEGMKPIVFAEQLMKKYAPGILRLTYPRIYERAETYHSAKDVGTMLGISLFVPYTLGMNAAPTTYRLMAPGLKPLLDRKIAPMFIAPALLDAVLASDFKDPIPWQEMHLPYEEGVFILPRGAIRHPIDGDAGFIFYSRQRAGHHTMAYRDAEGRVTADLDGDRFIFTVGFPNSPNLVWYDSNITAEARPTIQYGNIFWDEENQLWQERRVDLINQDWPLDEGDGEFLETMGRALFGTLLAMTARPELIGGARHINTVPAKKDRPAREYWSPNIIGQNYQTKRGEATAGTHASPRWHWRRGHYRNQPYGHEMKLRRVIWIEPTLICGA
jgi:hypothetical protein